MPSAIKSDETPTLNAGELFTFLADDEIPNEMPVIFRIGNVDHFVGMVKTQRNLLVLEAK